jgi:serine/threonine protein kinase
MTMPTTVGPVRKTAGPANFLTSLLDSGVLDDHQAGQARDRLARLRDGGDPLALAGRLVREGLLTEYQAAHLLHRGPRGLVLGRYVVTDFLGGGSMGKVYLARHRMLGRTVALKVLNSRFAGSDEGAGRFLREMQLVGRLDHPHVVRAHDADRVGGVLLLAMEYVRGQTLDKLLKRRGRLPLPEVLWYAYQAALGLGHAHRCGVVHRDVKPSNLLLGEDRRVRVLDLGLGALLERPELAPYQTDAHITVGTPDYIAPEQACCRPVDGRSDLYALGCSVYHLASGRLPFPGDSSVERIAMRIKGRARPIGELVPGMPPAVARVIDTLMAADPSGRYPDADEAARALRSLIRPRGWVLYTSPSPRDRQKSRMACSG